MICDFEHLTFKSITPYQKKH